jgi:RNA polymerase sigma-54 factor
MLGMNMNMSVDFEQQQTARLTPALIALNNMLVLSTADLQQLLEQELAENPALDTVEMEEAACPVCGHRLFGQVCLVCSNNELRDYNLTAPSEQGGGDDEYDPLLLVAAPMQLQEALHRDLRASLSTSDHPIADYLVGCLDERGFLDCELSDAARSLGVDEPRIEAVLKRLQEVAPTGVGARTVQECLLLQLDQLERDSTTQPFVREIITDHWDDLGAGRHTVIARALKISQDDVIAARDFIRLHLRPYPLEHTNSDGGRSPATTNYVLPDVVIREESDKFVVEVVESQRSFLRINPLYQELAAAARSGTSQVSDEEQEHLRSYISRARMFLTNLQQRRETIRRISEYIVERQEQFLRHGVRQLAPLTRAEVAYVLGVHDSTVSRATANKYAQLPNRSVTAFDTFFTASLSAKDVLREIIERENRPLTERRTVAKYRQQLGILPSTLR